MFIKKLFNNEILNENELDELLEYVIKIKNSEFDKINKMYNILIQHEYYIFNNYYKNNYDKNEYIYFINKILKICYNKLNNLNE